MSTIDLRFGNTSVPFTYNAARFDILTPDANSIPLSDAEIGSTLDHPIDSPSLEEIVKPGTRVLLVVPDATRQSGCAQIVNLVVRRLIANGSSPSNINIIFATGIHRPVTEDEKQALLTTFISQRIKVLSHDATDTVRNFRVGVTSAGIPVELNWLLTEFDHVVLIGSVTFHYFAGFTGGRKLICPGLASTRTIEETHKLAFDCNTKDRRQGVGTALLDDNPVHEAFQEAAALIDPAFSIMTIVNDSGEVTEVHCGNWITSHRQACDSYLAGHAAKINERRNIVIASCGGYPLDINIIQAHKTLEAASQVCVEGGTIIMLAECADGLGRADFLNWFEANNSDDLATQLCDRYQVNGQTAWSLLRKAERFDIRIMTSLSVSELERMRLRKVDSLEHALSDLGSATGYVLPFAAKTLPQIV